MSDIDDPAERPLPAPQQSDDNAQFSSGAELSAEADRFSSLISETDPPDDSSDTRATDATDATSRDTADRAQAKRQVSPRDHKRDGERGEESGAREHRHRTDKGSDASPGDQILRGMLGGAPTTEERKDSAGALDTTARVDQVSEIASAVADRILVTDPSSGANREVRILLKGRLLGGTEVRISHVHGDIQVRLTAPGSEVGQQIESHLGELQGVLAGRLNATVKVSVDVQGGNPHQGGADTSGGGDGGDGRSRNQRRIIDEWNGGDAPNRDR